MNIKPVITKAQTFLVDNSSTILTGIGVVGVVTTSVMAVKATPKACYLIDIAATEKIENDPDLDICENGVRANIEILGPKETIKVAWKCYIPSVALGLLTIACFIASYKSSTMKQAAIASAYSLAERTLKDYQEKIVEVVGEEKSEEIHDAVIKKQFENDYSSEEIIPFGTGEHLCYDSLTGRYFKSDVETIRARMNDFNHELNADYYADLNYWYIILELPSVEIGHSLGWNSNRLMNISFSSQIAPNGEPCIVLDYTSSQPSPFYRNTIM